MEKIVLGLGVLVLGFFSQVTPKKIERRLEKTLRKSLNAKSVDVDLVGSAGLSTLQGKFKKLAIKIEGLSIKSGQLAEILPIRFTDKPKKKGRIKEVHIFLQDTNYDGLNIAELKAVTGTVVFDLKASMTEKRLVIASASVGTIKGSITIEALQNYLSELSKKNDIDDLKLTLRNDSAIVNGLWRFTVKKVTLFRLPFNAVVKLYPTKATEIHWRIVKVTVAKIIPVPVNWLQAQLKAFNPIIRFDLTPLRVNLTAVRIMDLNGVEFLADFYILPKTFYRFEKILHYLPFG